MAGFKAAMFLGNADGSQNFKPYIVYKAILKIRELKKKHKQGHAILSVITHKFQGFDHNSPF